MLKEKTISELALFFKLFGDITRLRIIHALLQSEMCVQHIAEELHLEQSTVSHQLGTLNMAHIVKKRRAGKMIYYSLEDEHVSTIFNLGLEHINE